MCGEAVVTLAASEVAGLARALAVSPSLFTALAACGASTAAAGFRLAPQDRMSPGPTGDHVAPSPAFALTLRKVAGRCAFAHAVQGGRRICGLGALRPRACDRAGEVVSDPHEAATRVRWHAALDAGSHPMPAEVLLAFLLGAEEAGAHRPDGAGGPGVDRPDGACPPEEGP